jgi:hypothetical protein
MEENKEAGAIYMITRRQVITQGMEGHIIDISIPAIKDVMDVRGVKDESDCLNKVLHTFRHFLDERQRTHD